MTLLAFPGLASRSPEFLSGIEEVGKRLSTDPNWLLTIMQLESGIRPDARNPHGKATGLIQFMPQTAKALGTTVDELQVMQDHEQLPYVEAFYKRYTGKFNGPGDVYMTTFYPASAFKSRDTVIAKKGQPVYNQNAVLDTNGDGIITVGDVMTKAENTYAYYAAKPPFQLAPSDTRAQAFSGSLAVGAALAFAGGLWLLRRRTTRAIAGRR